MIKSNKIYFCIILTTLLIFALLFGIGTFFDYEISNYIASPFLKDGNYYSTSNLAFFFEIFGEFITYICCSIALIILSVFILKSSENKITFLSAIFLVISSVIVYIGVYRAKKVYLELYDLSFLKSTWFTIISVVFSIIFCGILFSLILKISIDKLKRFVPILVMFLSTVVLSQFFVQVLLKPFFGRERFRAIYYFTYNNLDHNGFSPWYVLNGNSKMSALKYGVSDDLFKSFPSGHATSAGAFISMFSIPFIYKKVSKKVKIFSIIFPFVYVIFVSFTRLLGGAHFVSDLTFAIILDYICVLLSFFIFRKLISNINSKFSI